MIQASLLLIVNHLLTQEPWAQDKVRAQAGKIVAIKTGTLELRVELTGNGTVIAAANDATPHATLTFAPDLLPHILQHGMAAAAQKVHIAGEAELVAVVGDVLQHLRWDAEQDLSRLVGDIPARRLTQAAKTFAAHSEEAAQRLRENFAEYFTEENPMLVTRPQLEAHRTDLHALRDQIARLEKRMQKL